MAVGSRVAGSNETYASSRPRSTPPRAARTAESRAAAVRSQRSVGTTAGGTAEEAPVEKSSATALYVRRACERMRLVYRSTAVTCPSGSMRSSAVSAGRSWPSRRLMASLESTSGSIGMTRPAR